MNLKRGDGDEWKVKLDLRRISVNQCVGQHDSMGRRVAFHPTCCCGFLLLYNFSYRFLDNLWKEIDLKLPAVISTVNFWAPSIAADWIWVTN